MIPSNDRPFFSFINFVKSTISSNSRPHLSIPTLTSMITPKVREFSSKAFDNSFTLSSFSTATITLDILLTFTNL